MTQTSTASSRMTANSAWREGASGVVSNEAAGTPAMRVPIVPTTAERRVPSAASARYVVVVLPWVPVTPTVVNASDGWPWNQADRSASRARGSSTTRVGTSSASTRPAPSASVSTATAPASRAAAAWSAPCDLEPGRAAYRSPGSTRAVLRLMPVSSVASPPATPLVRIPGPGRSSAQWAATSARVWWGGSAGLTRITSTTIRPYPGSSPSPVLLDLGRLRAGGHDAEPLQGHRHDVVEHRAGRGAAARVRVRLVEHDVREEPRLVGWREPDE